MQNETSLRSPYALAEVQASFMRQVYAWMTGGVALTALCSLFMWENPSLMNLLFSNKVLFYGLMIGQIGLVIGLSAAKNRLSAAAATGLYLLYSGLTGITLSAIFVIYAQETIAGIFFTTAFAFAGLSLLGYTTKRDLGPLGAFCGMAVFGMLGWALLSMFWPSLMGGQGQTVYSIIGVLVFSGLTAYDTQKIKKIATSGPTGEAAKKAAIYGALTLYLDFINLFLMLLRLAGGNRR